MEGDGVALACLISGILFAVLGLASFSILWAVNWRPWRIYSEARLMLCALSMSVFVLFQLDFRPKMAEYFTRTSTGYAMCSFISSGMGDCFISSCGAYHVGMLANHNIRQRYCWSGSNNGRHCSIIGILFNYALVEDSMAKLKYAS
ncbi:hypothetical protein Golob_023592 [Gossypium lobatum]|uniref:Uncharacterized protein n=1 Tax=Gossypium lobatum TaxID=34289 RepID=A0A7J8LK84_9ROSI|nr:hypothetical protein [Gossypium lobatum]